MEMVQVTEILSFEDPSSFLAHLVSFCDHPSSVRRLFTIDFNANFS